MITPHLSISAFRCARSSSGDEPMTPAQRSYLETLAQDTGETVDETLTKAEASKRIDELRDRSPRVSGEQS